MVLNKPKFMKPSTNKEECTIDLTADIIPFSCIVDGNESITKWQIKIYDITNNEEVFRTEEITLGSPFYPVDEKNRNVVFPVNLKDYFKDESGNLRYPEFKNRAEAYYWTITLWGTSRYSTTSYQEVFYANGAPNISILYKYHSGTDYSALNNGDVLISRACTFKAIYEQTDSVQLKRYGWRISDTDSGQVFIDTISNNQIYGSVDNIICNYDGFLNDGNYSVELFIETQNNTKITTSPLSFSVSYESTFLSNDFKVETLENEPAIMLDWNKSVVISGVLKDTSDNIVSIDDTPFKTNYPVNTQCSIEIPNKFKVVYDNSSLDINEDSYIALSTQLLGGADTVVFFAEGFDDNGYEVKRKLSYSNGEFRYDVVGQQGIIRDATYLVINKPSQYVWYIIFMSPLVKDDNGNYAVKLDIIESKVVNCIYPRVDLYPEEDFYPTFGNWDKLKGVQAYGV